jgi:hypothetical protein
VILNLLKIPENLSTENLPIFKRVARGGLRDDYPHIPRIPCVGIGNNMLIRMNDREPPPSR